VNPLNPFAKLTITVFTMMFIGVVAGLHAGYQGDELNTIFAQGFLAGLGLLWWICAVVFDAFHFDGEPQRIEPIGSGLFGGPPPG
jgi:hypothetical protein